MKATDHPAMNPQAQLALPPAADPRSLTLDQVRALAVAAEEKLRAASPQLARMLDVLATAAPESRRAALVALQTAADAGQRRTLATLRALAQLLLDAEAHATRQPGTARAVTVAPVDASAAAKPLSLLTEDTQQPINPS